MILFRPRAYNGLARVPLRAREIAASPVEGHHSEPGTIVTILPSHDPNAYRGAKGSSQRIATMRALNRTSALQRQTSNGFN